MAIADPYADVARYKLQMDKTSSADDAVLLSQLKAVSRWMDRKLGMFFGQDVDAVSRLYSGQGDGYGRAGKIIDVDPIASVTGLTIKIDSDNDGSFTDETALAVTDYRLLPLNALYGPEARPYTQIELPAWGTESVWPVGYGVQVTAVYGWPAVPEAIVNACVEFTAMLRGESPFATGRITEMDQLETVSPQARGLLKGLMEVYSPTGGIAVA